MIQLSYFALEPSSFGQQLAGYMSQLKQQLIDSFVASAIPPEVLSSSDPCLVHISDTPSVFYPTLFRLLEKIKPHVLIHTGDMVDHLKLQNHAYLYNLYQEQLQQFIGRLENLPVDIIYLVPGNHDDPDLISRICRRCRVIPEYSLVQFGAFKLGLAHEPQNLPPKADFALYGHSLDEPPATAGQPLSGLKNINILLPDGRIYFIPYPRGTDVARGIKPRPRKL